MSTDRFGIIQETWTTEEGRWGNKMLGNFELIEAISPVLNTIIKWQAGATYNVDDTIYDPETGLVAKAVSAFTVPSNTRFVEYATASATRARITYYTPDTQVISCLSTDTGGVAIDVSDTGIYTFKAITDLSAEGTKVLAGTYILDSADNAMDISSMFADYPLTSTTLRTVSSATMFYEACNDITLYNTGATAANSIRGRIFMSPCMNMTPFSTGFITSATAGVSMKSIKFTSAIPFTFHLIKKYWPL